MDELKLAGKRTVSSRGIGKAVTQTAPHTDRREPSPVELILELQRVFPDFRVAMEEHDEIYNPISLHTVMMDFAYWIGISLPTATQKQVENQSPVSASEAVALTPARMAKMLSEKDREIGELRHQLAWFQRQIFGSKSERRLPPPDVTQGLLGQGFSALPESPQTGKKSRVATHEREAKPKPPREGADESVPFFDETKVPVRVIAVPNPEIRDQNLAGDAKKQYRQRHAKPLVERFFIWVNKLFEAQGFLPSSPFTKALGYVRDRREGLEVFLSDPDVPIATNPIERALRVIPMGRRNWLFGWTELGAKHVGMMQRLLATCRLRDVNPYDYLVDVLQRIGQHPASKVEELTPGRWKDLFAADPIRSDLYSFAN